MGFRWAAARRHVGAPAGVSGRGVPRGTPFHPPIPAVSPAGLSRARWASSGTPPRLAPAQDGLPANWLPVDGCQAACGGPSRRVGPRRSTWNSLPPANSRGLARRVESGPGQLGHASQTGCSLRTGSRRIGSRWTAARRRVEPAAGVSGRGATWTSFRLLVPGLALLGGRVHEAVPAALPQRVSSRSLRTGETRLRRRQQPVTSVGRRRQRCGGPAAVAAWPRRSTWNSVHSNVPPGLALRMWSQAPWGRHPTNASAASRDRAHGGWPRRRTSRSLPDPVAASCGVSPARSRRLNVEAFHVELLPSDSSLGLARRVGAGLPGTHKRPPRPPRHGRRMAAPQGLQSFLLPRRLPATAYRQTGAQNAFVPTCSTWNPTPGQFPSPPPRAGKMWVRAGSSGGEPCT